MPSHASSTTPTAPSAQVPFHAFPRLLRILESSQLPGVHARQSTTTLMLCPDKSPHGLTGLFPEHERPGIALKSGKQRISCPQMASIRHLSMVEAGKQCADPHSVVRTSIELKVDAVRVH